VPRVRITRAPVVSRLGRGSPRGSGERTRLRFSRISIARCRTYPLLRVCPSPLVTVSPPRHRSTPYAPTPPVPASGHSTANSSACYLTFCQPAPRLARPYPLCAADGRRHSRTKKTVATVHVAMFDATGESAMSAFSAAGRSADGQPRHRGTHEPAGLLRVPPPLRVPSRSELSAYRRAILGRSDAQRRCRHDAAAAGYEDCDISLESGRLRVRRWGAAAAPAAVCVRASLSANL